MARKKPNCCQVSGRIGESLTLGAMRLLVAVVLICNANGAVDESPLTADEKQTHFNRLVGMADRVYIETQIEGAAVDIMRAAFQICPYCKNSTFHHKGQFSETVFEFEDFADRRYMSEFIIPAVIGHKPERVLWVGVQPYTLRTVYQLEAAGIDVSTIEPNPGMAPFGSSKHHMKAPIGALGMFVEAQSYDVIIINGVIGWGLDDEDLIEEAVKVMHKHLKNNGILVVGHNRGRGTCCSFGPLFTPHSFGQLPTIHEDPDSETKHVYEFFIKNQGY